MGPLSMNPWDVAMRQQQAAQQAPQSSLQGLPPGAGANPNALYGVGPTGPPQPASGIPQGWQNALAQVGQAAQANPQMAAQAAAMQQGLQNQALQSQLGALSPQAVQAGRGILAGQRPLIRS